MTAMYVTSRSLGSMQLISQTQEWARQVGVQVNEEEFEQKQLIRSKVEEDSAKIARILEKGGYPAYLPDTLSMVSPKTGEAVKLPNYRHIQIIPIVSYRDARQSKDRLEAYLQNQKCDALYSIVLSAGMVAVSDYRNGHLSFTKEMASAHLWMRRNGFEPIFYATERTPFIKDGKSYVNLHAHMIFKRHSNGSIKKLSDYLFKKFHWKSSPKRIELKDISAAAAYLHKPDKFADAVGFDLVTLAKQQEGLNFRQPLGSFRKFVQNLNSSKLRPSKHSDGTFALVPRYERRRLPFGILRANQPNRIVRITRPVCIGSDPTQVPALIVQNYDGDFEALIKPENINKFVCRVRSACAVPTNKAFITDTLTTTNTPINNNLISNQYDSDEIPF